jgi:hypothetical protein
MKDIRRFIERTTIVFAGSVLLFGNIGLAEAPTALTAKEALRSLQQQWKMNQREYLAEQQRIHDQADQVRKQLCREGHGDYCTGVDIKKLAYAVAMAETEDCRTGTGKSKNNCHGIFECINGICRPKTYASKEESYREFEQIWLKNYGDHFPTLADAQRYVDSPATEWYATVKAVYYGSES